MNVKGQCLLISFQPENHFHAPKRTGPIKFQNITLATEMSSYFDIKNTLCAYAYTQETYCTSLEAQTSKDRRLLIYTWPSKTVYGLIIFIYF